VLTVTAGEGESDHDTAMTTRQEGKEEEGKEGEGGFFDRGEK